MAFNSKKISRKDFLKLVGAGATVLVFAKFFDFSGLKGLSQLSSSSSSPNSLSQLPQARAQSSEPWTVGPLSSIAAIHASLLPNGKILAIAGSGYHAATKDGPYEAKIVDPNTGSEVPYTFSEDFFCIGHCHLANGNVLCAGGTTKYDTDNPEGRFQGLNSAYEFNVYTNSFEKVTSMAHGRWYPTLITLTDGKAWVVDGLDEFGIRNALVEVYDPATKRFNIQYDPTSSITYCAGQTSTLPGAGTQCYGGPNQGVSPPLSLYPRAHLMPSGLILVCGMDRPLYLVNPTTGAWTALGQTQFFREYGVSFLLPLNNTATERGRVLIAGGNINPVFPQPATRTAEMIDFNAGTNTAPVVRNSASMNVGREFGMPIILPTGKLVVFGGTIANALDYNHTPEIFDPVSETWTTLPDANVSRTYHSIALLLLDGRVWVTSGTPDRISWEHRTEFYNPPYVFANNRPTINGRVRSAQYGGTINIPTANATDIASVSLVRLGSQTHHFDPNMRLVWLQIVRRDSTSIDVSAPINANIAPPGFYMIHVLNANEIPSVAQVIKIPG